MQLKEEHPDLLQRALAIEDNAIEQGTLKSTKGLGRRFAWRTFIETPEKVSERDAPAEPCTSCADDSGDRLWAQCTMDLGDQDMKA